MRLFSQKITLILLVINIVACNGNDNAATLNINSQGTTSFNLVNLQTQLNALALGELSASAIEGLLLMREEEKLARDVYTYLYHKHATPIFNNIAASEQTHTDAIKLLLDRYNLTDPASNDTPGQFTNQELQWLYTTLIDAGSVSLLEGLYVGARVEELDIYDITRLQQSVINNPDIMLVYSNLLKGSRNHLRAFNKLIISNGGLYTPTYISQEEFETIVNSPVER